MMRRAVSWMLTAAMLFALIPLRARAEEPMPDEEPLPAEETLIPEETVPPEETALPEETELPEFSPEPEETPAPEPGLSAFAVLEPLPALPFADVPSGAWYHDAVQTLYALNLVSGVSSTAFSPSSALTAGQCAALSVRIYAAYHGAEIDVTYEVPAPPTEALYFKESSAWTAATKAYKKIGGLWVEQTDLTDVFDSSTNYVKGN